jgi:hypothetical protein
MPPNKVKQNKVKQKMPKQKRPPQIATAFFDVEKLKKIDKQEI